MKKCYICKKEYPRTTEFFHRNRARSDGLNSECKSCKSKQNKQRYKINKEENKRWTQEEDTYLSKRFSELLDKQVVDRICIISKEMNKTTYSVKNRIYQKGLHKQYAQNEEKFITRKNIKCDYSVGMKVKAKKRRVTKSDIPSITGRVTGVYDNFIVVDNGRIRESFTYVDIVTGNVSVKEVGT